MVLRCPCVDGSGGQQVGDRTDRFCIDCADHPIVVPVRQAAAERPDCGFPAGANCFHAGEGLDGRSGVLGANYKSRFLLAGELIVEPVGHEVGQVLRRDAANCLGWYAFQK